MTSETAALGATGPTPAPAACEVSRSIDSEAEEILAARYCLLTEAGYPPQDALAIATQPEADGNSTSEE